jgi:hypothetical protein
MHHDIRPPGPHQRFQVAQHRWGQDLAKQARQIPAEDLIGRELMGVFIRKALGKPAEGSGHGQSGVEGSEAGGFGLAT